jgi:hypothetical protein
MDLLVEVVGSHEAPPPDLYIPVLIGIIDPKDASTLLNLLSEKLPLELYGVSVATRTIIRTI